MLTQHSLHRASSSVPEAMVVPTPLRLVSVDMADSNCGIFLKAFLVSVWTALGVLIMTRFVSWGKNLPRCSDAKKEKGKKERKSK